MPILTLVWLIAAAARLPAQEGGEGVDSPDGRFGPYLRDVGALLEPVDAAILGDGTVLVLERGAQRVVVLDAKGVRSGSFGGPGGEAGGLRRPEGIAMGPGGRIHVADTGNDRVVVFEEDGKLVAVRGGRGFGDGLFLRPEGIAVDATAVYVADTGNHRVQVLDHEGRHLRSFGRLGSEPGSFRSPVAVAVDPDGDVYVADSTNHRIQVFDREGRFLRGWGELGLHPGMLAAPSDVEWFGGRVYVADRENHRVQVFSPAGEALYEWGKHAIRPREGEGNLYYPSGIAIAPGGAFAVVCEAFQDRLQVFGPAGGPPELYSTDPAILGVTQTPHFGTSISCSGDLLALFEPETQSLLLYDLDFEEPVRISRFGAYGRTPARFLRIADVAVDAERGVLTVSDRGGRSIQSFALDHEPDAPLRFDPTMASLLRSADLEAVGARAGWEGGPVEPGAIATDAEGNVYVVDELRARIVVLSPGMELLRQWGGHGTQEGHLRDPSDLAFGQDGKVLYVVDQGNHRIQAFDRDGAFLRAFGSRELRLPHGVAVGPRGRIHVTDAGAHRVLVFGADGALLRSWGGEGLGAGRFYKPRGIAIDAGGRIVVMDHGNHRGQVFSPDGAFELAFGPRLYVAPTRSGR